MNRKELYTKIFLKELNKSTSDMTVKEYMPLWWKNNRAKETGGLRLTDDGYDIVTQIDLRTYDVPFPKEFTLTAQSIIFLDQFITCTYYLTNKGVVVLDERTAVELTLFSGDVRKYGLAKAMTRSKKTSETS